MGTTCIAVDGTLIEIHDRDLTLTLHEFLRTRTSVHTVKWACGEGGCGACCVEVVRHDVKTGSTTTRTVNSCIVPVFLLDGCAIFSAAGIGNSKTGYHPVQEHIGALHASQCGFCTPGFSVACHAALARCQERETPATAVDICDALDGNLCRCTGYRPLQDVCKAVSGCDIEDLGLNKLSPPLLPCKVNEPQLPERLLQYLKTGSPATSCSGYDTAVGPLYVPLSTASLEKVLHDLAADPKTVQPIRLVAGSTGRGVFKDWPSAATLVSLHKVSDLHTISVTDSKQLLIGAAVTLSEVREYMQNATLCNPQPWQEIDAHLGRVAGTHVRNIASIGGNLALARLKQFPSDVATIFGAAGAQLTIVSVKHGRITLDVASFLASSHPALSDLGKTSFITSIALPIPGAHDRIWTSRMAHRYINAKALINMAVWVKLGQGSHSNGNVKGPISHQLSSMLTDDGHTNGRVGDVNGHAIADVESHGLELDGTDAGTNKHVNGMSSSAVDARVMVGIESGDDVKSEWHCIRLTEVENIITAHGMAGPETLVAAAQALEDKLHYFLPKKERQLRLVSSEEDERRGSKDGAGSTYVLLAAEGMLIQGLSAVLGLSREQLGEAVEKMPKPAMVQSKQVVPAPKKEVAPIMEPVPKTGILLQASGEAVYAGDVPVTKDALYAAWVLSDVAVGEVASINTTAALKLPGVVRFIGADDIPENGVNEFGGGSSLPPVEPLFSKSVAYCGESVGVVLATSPSAAEEAAKLIKVTYEPPSDNAKPVLSLQEAVAHGSTAWTPPGIIPTSKVVGDTASVFAQAKEPGSKLKVVKGRYVFGSQLHFYMEPQTAVAMPDEGGKVVVHVSTQTLAPIQAAVANVLGVTQNKVIIKCRRTGGGFGGKVMRAGKFAAATALAAQLTGQQVRIVASKNTDMAMSGGRNETVASYKAVVGEDGTLEALVVEAQQLCGAYMDLGFVDSIHFCSEFGGVYRVKNFKFSFQLYRANIAPHTAVRAPGKLQFQLVMENIMEHVAAELGLSPELVRERNFVTAKPGEPVIDTLSQPVAAHLYTLPRIWGELKKACEFEEREAAVREFNGRNRGRKRGIGMVPCRFTVQLPRLPAAVMVYADGSVQVAHPGVEIGQGLTVKVLQVAAYELSKALPPGSGPVPLDLISAADNSTELLPHGCITAASMASESSCGAVQAACVKLVEQIRPFAEKLEGSYTWPQLIQSIKSRMPGAMQGLMCAYGFGGVDMPEGVPPSYDVFGAACSEVEVDVLTGDRRLLQTDILFDCGDSFNPAADLGQVEGAFVFGLGALLSEDVHHHPETGKIINNSTWTYKIPAITCIPQIFNVTMLKDSPRHVAGPVGAKAVGEPPLLLSPSVMFALQHAVQAARETMEAGGGAYQPLLAPATPERVRLACGSWKARDLLVTRPSKANKV